MGEGPGSQGGFPGPILPPGQPQLQELEKDPQGLLAPKNPISKEESIAPDGLPFPSGQQPLLVQQNPRDQQASGDPNPLLQHLVGCAQDAIPPEHDFMHRENLSKQAIHQELEEIRRAEAQLKKQQDLIGQQRLFAESRARDQQALLAQQRALEQQQRSKGARTRMPPSGPPLVHQPQQGLGGIGIGKTPGHPRTEDLSQLVQALSGQDETLIRALRDILSEQLRETPQGRTRPPGVNRSLSFRDGRGARVQMGPTTSPL